MTLVASVPRLAREEAAIHAGSGTRARPVCRQVGQGQTQLPPGSNRRWGWAASPATVGALRRTHDGAIGEVQDVGGRRPAERRCTHDCKLRNRGECAHPGDGPPSMAIRPESWTNRGDIRRCAAEVGGRTGASSPAVRVVRPTTRCSAGQETQGNGAQLHGSGLQARSASPCTHRRRTAGSPRS